MLNISSAAFDITVFFYCQSLASNVGSRRNVTTEV